MIKTKITDIINMSEFFETLTFEEEIEVKLKLKTTIQQVKKLGVSSTAMLNKISIFHVI